MVSRKIIAEKREHRPKGLIKTLRKEGKLPAILYGKDIPVMLSVSLKEVQNLLLSTSEHAVFTLQYEGSEHEVLVKDYQIHPISRKYMHIDFQEIRPDTKIRTPIAIHLVGSAHGTRQGGILEHHLHELEIECLPRDIPERIEIDVSSLDVGEVIHINDLSLSDSIRVLSDGEQVVVLVSAPKKEVEQVEESLEEDEEESQEQSEQSD